DLSYDIYINSKPEDIWNIFISPEGTKAIFFGCILKSTFEVGASYEYIGPGADGDETVHVYGEILAYEPYKMMSYTEHAGPSY
ncbi:SRPBCC domain-containing protein, partial [Pseudomonas sp. FW305-BF6]|uniref:SRPBCC domain-containing protein n=1 Tax=Pseudomonas sp. FW305-BF6 TaxID=2070673 RepID=UPI001C495068